MERIAPVEAIPEDSTFLFRVAPVDGGDHREAILLWSDEEVVGWLNYCQHMTHIKLDKGSGATTRDDEVVCRNHGAMFEAGSGLCTFGPCEGAYLDPVEVVLEDGVVYLDDPDYEFVGEGALEEDGDLSSTSNIEF